MYCHHNMQSCRPGQTVHRQWLSYTITMIPSDLLGFHNVQILSDYRQWVGMCPSQPPGWVEMEWRVWPPGGGTLCTGATLHWAPGPCSRQESLAGWLPPSIIIGETLLLSTSAFRKNIISSLALAEGTMTPCLQITKKTVRKSVLK